jgi:hypothetical protein
MAPVSVGHFLLEMPRTFKIRGINYFPNTAWTKPLLTSCSASETLQDNTAASFATMANRG